MNLGNKESKGIKVLFSSAIKNKIFWTLGILSLYLALLNIPIIGVSRFYYGEDIFDPLSLYRVITASEFRSLAELGIIPIVLAAIILQILIGLRIIKVDFSKTEDRKLYAITYKILALILTIIFALVFSLSGIYGEDIPYYLKIAIFIQIIAAGFLIILMDELIVRGYGLGSGTSLFILASVCYTIFEGMFSLNQQFVGGQSWYSGCIIAFFQGIRRGDLLTPFYNTYFPYILLDFILLLVVTAIIIYFILIKLEIPAQSKTDGVSTRYPIMSLYTFYIPVVFSSILFAIIAFVYNLITISEPGGFFGIFFSPYGPEQIVQQPALVVGYIIMMTIFCGFFSRAWYTTAGMDSLSVAKQFLSKDLLIPGFREHPKTVQKYLNQYIPIAIWIGGFIIGFIAGLADFLGPLGTGTGVLVSICIIREYYDIISKEFLNS